VTATNGFRVLTRELLSDHGFIALENHRIQGPTGEVVNRVVVAHPGAVAIVPLIGDDIILIEQYRAPVDTFVLEIPAGKLDTADTSRVTAARRELLEETGYVAAELSRLTAILPAVGFSNEEITIYLAESLTPGESSPDGIEEHAATIVRMPFSQAVGKVLDGTIVDSKSIAGIMIAYAHRQGGTRP
jgi:ADP-ribose pyrophosphatase